MSGGPDLTEVIWNDVECGGYEADLTLWEELAARFGGPILELGCGSGRVTHRLAEKTSELVLGVDHDPDLVAAVWARAAHGHAGDAEVGDVRAFELAYEFRLALAPMQLIQLLPERADRTCCLACVADHLRPGGVAAFAILEAEPEIHGEAPPPLPDVRQVGEWVYSSLPLPPRREGDSVLVRRLRQVVSPDGNLREHLSEIELQMLSADELEAEAAELGFRSLARRRIAASSDHVGSTVVLLERAA
jgi:SAM-dependent methyltransferase